LYKLPKIHTHTHIYKIPIATGAHRVNNQT